MLKRILIFGSFLFFLPLKVFAICPVCTVAVGAGVGLSRWLGIDDTITGIWIGSLFMSIFLWSVDWVRSKKWKFRGYKIAIFIFYILFIIAPLFWMDVFFHPFNKIWGLDKLFLGIFLGIIFFVLSVKLHFYLKKNNSDKVYFPFQKVVLTVGTSLFLSLIFYFITK